MPAKAGIHSLLEQWISAYAGITIERLVETMTNPQYDGDNQYEYPSSVWSFLWNGLNDF